MDISGVGTAELVEFDGVEMGLELELLVVVDDDARVMELEVSVYCVFADELLASLVVDKGDAELLALHVADVDEV